MQHDDHVQWERESKRRRVTYSIAGSSTDAAGATTASPAPCHQWVYSHRDDSPAPVCVAEPHVIVDDGEVAAVKEAAMPGARYVGAGGSFRLTEPTSSGEIGDAFMLPLNAPNTDDADPVTAVAVEVQLRNEALLVQVTTEAENVEMATADAQSSCAAIIAELGADTVAVPGKFFVETEGEEVAEQYLPVGSDVVEDISARDLRQHCRSLSNFDRRTNARLGLKIMEDDGRPVINWFDDKRFVKGGLRPLLPSWVLPIWHTWRHVDGCCRFGCLVPSRSQVASATIAPKVDTQGMSRSQLERIVEEDAKTGSGFLQRHHTCGHESGAGVEVPLRRLRATSRSHDDEEVKPTWCLPGRGHIKSTEGPAGGKAGKADG